MQLTVLGAPCYAYTGGKAFDAALPVVVFLHGAELDHSVWALQSRYLAHHGYAVLAVDLPGHGRSGGAPPASVEALADWVAALLDAAGVGAATLVGHSMGSLVALEAAARHPARVERLALISTAIPMKVATPLLEATRDEEARAQGMVNAWSHAQLAPAFSMQCAGNHAPGFSVAGSNLRLMQRQKPGVMHADFAACNNYVAGLASAAKVQCPTLLLLGQRDFMTPPRAARELAAAIQGARVVTIPNAGHNLMGEAPDEVLDRLRSFLSEQRKAA